REVRVVGLAVRPKSYDAPRIVGTLYLDAGTADLVRMAFNFTPRAYLDPSLEDVSIALDNALWEGRFWLPFRQEGEIRRRGAWACAGSPTWCTRTGSRGWPWARGSCGAAGGRRASCARSRATARPMTGPRARSR